MISAPSPQELVANALEELPGSLAGLIAEHGELIEYLRKSNPKEVAPRNIVEASMRSSTLLNLVGELDPTDPTSLIMLQVAAAQMKTGAMAASGLVAAWGHAAGFVAERIGK